jgi:arylsulfatase A
MKDAGYHTAIAGKWQLNGRHAKMEGWEDLKRPHVFGFDEYCLWQVNRGKQEGERFADPLIVKNAVEMEGLEDAYGPDVFTEFVLNFIDKHKNEPFFIYYPMVLVHDPFVPTPDSEEWSDPSRRYENDTTYFEDMVEYTDKIVGKIVEKLDETGNMDNTLLIFTGDNGTHVSINTDMKEGTYQGGKGKPFDPGTRVPLVISWPEVIEKPLFYNGLVEFSDFFATLADITDQEHSSDGVSLLPFLKGETDLHRETVFVHYAPKWGRFENARFVRTLTYKLYADGRFYDMLSDPREQHALDTTGMSPQQEEVYERLSGELDKHPPTGLVD